MNFNIFIKKKQRDSLLTTANSSNVKFIEVKNLAKIPTVEKLTYINNPYYFVNLNFIIPAQ